MFLLPSLGFGLLFAVLLGGRPSRVFAIKFRLTWTVLVALALQVVIFTRLGASIGEDWREAAHLTSYGFLIVFAFANLRARMLMPVLAGLALNALAIAANGGQMPLSARAAQAAGIAPAPSANVSVHATHLRFLGDVFALPAQVPLANIFSVGDVLIALGMIAFIVGVSTTGDLDPALSLGRVVAPLRTPAYRSLIGGRLISQIGDWLTIAALVGWIYDTTRSTSQVAAVLLVRLGPPILGSGFAAVVVDRLPKRRLLVGVELVRATTIAVAVTGVVWHSRPLVFAALALAGSLATVSSAALSAALPGVLPREQLASANAGLGIAKDVAMALGAAAGGLALARFGVTDALAVDFATFIAAAYLYARLRGIAFERPQRRAAGRPSGLRYLVRHPKLLLLAAAFATATLATGLTNATLPRFLGQSVGLGAGAYGFGIACLASGLAVGEACVGFTRAGSTAGRWIGVGLMMMSGLFVLLALSTHPPTALLLLFGIGFVDGTTDVLYQTIVQRRAHPHYYGCVFGFSSAFMVSTMMCAFVAAPVANGVLGSRAVILIASVILLAAGALGLAALEPDRRRSYTAPAQARA